MLKKKVSNHFKHFHSPFARSPPETMLLFLSQVYLSQQVRNGGKSACDYLHTHGIIRTQSVDTSIFCTIFKNIPHLWMVSTAPTVNKGLQKQTSQKSFSMLHFPERNIIVMSVEEKQRLSAEVRASKTSSSSYQNKIKFMETCGCQYMQKLMATTPPSASPLKSESFQKNHPPFFSNRLSNMRGGAD